MRSAKDFQAGCAAQLRAHRAVGPRSPFGEKSIEPGEGLEEHERGGGGHFSPSPEGFSASQAPQLQSFAGFFFGQKPHGRSRQAGSQGEDLRGHGFDLRRYGGEGKTASSVLRNQAGGIRIPPRAAVRAKRGPPTPPTGIHLPPAETFLRQSIPRRCDAIPDRGPRAKSIASRPGTARP
jgi:hypothetical protein